MPTNPNCKHGTPAKLVLVKKEGPNKGRKFFCCPNDKSTQCDFFQWENEEWYSAGVMKILEKLEEMDKRLLLLVKAEKDLNVPIVEEEKDTLADLPF